ncbi:MAG: hypothetical protein KF774_15190 [Planctomyces sp.]|nr:hypothetical protein [Planctomyces sp.]
MTYRLSGSVGAFPASQKVWQPDEARRCWRSWRGLEPAEKPPAVREAHRQLTGYLRNNVHRMNYPRCLAHGWEIGSGAIESACQNIVGRRLKGPGMQWRERGTTSQCQWRALDRSETPL